MGGQEVDETSSGGPGWWKEENDKRSSDCPPAPTINHQDHDIVASGFARPRPLDALTGSVLTADPFSRRWRRR
jgi:hypothetical protein